MPQKKTAKKSKPKSQVKSYHHGDLKNALLDSSIALLRNHGPQAFSLRELALSLGVSSAAPYRHFKTKEKLFSALAVQGFEVLTMGFRKAIEAHPFEPMEQLHGIGVSYYRFAGEHPEQLQMMFGNIIPQIEIANDAEFGAAAGKAFKALCEAVKACQDAGLLDVKMDVKKLAIIIWSAIHGFASLHLTGTLQGASGLSYNAENLVRQISIAITSGLKSV